MHPWKGIEDKYATFPVTVELCKSKWFSVSCSLLGASRKYAVTSSSRDVFPREAISKFRNARRQREIGRLLTYILPRCLPATVKPQMTLDLFHVIWPWPRLNSHYAVILKADVLEKKSWQTTCPLETYELVFFPKLRLSSVHLPRICRLDDIGCAKDQRNFWWKI